MHLISNTIKVLEENTGVPVWPLCDLCDLEFVSSFLDTIVKAQVRK